MRRSSPPARTATSPTRRARRTGRPCRPPRRGEADHRVHRHLAETDRVELRPNRRHVPAHRMNPTGLVAAVDEQPPVPRNRTAPSTGTPPRPHRASHRSTRCPTVRQRDGRGCHRVAGTLRSCNVTASTSSVSRRRVSRRSLSTPFTATVMDDGSSASSFMTRPTTPGPRLDSCSRSCPATRRWRSRSVDGPAVPRSIAGGGGNGSELRTGSQITQTTEFEYRSHHAFDRAGTGAEHRAHVSSWRSVSSLRPMCSHRRRPARP